MPPGTRHTVAGAPRRDRHRRRFSARALSFARELAEGAGLTATFVEGDVRAVRTLVTGPFDLVFATWGVLCWVPDSRAWMHNAASLLAPGGRLYLADTHPTSAQFDEVPDASGTARLMVAEPWRTAIDKPLVLTQRQPYTGDPTPIAHAECREWLHPLSDIIAAVDDAGLVLQTFHEHEATTYRQFRSMRRGPDGLWRMPPGRPRVPHAFSLMAVKLR
ncbi:MAG: class I SAM-dependent methyltransferase [Alphaproteobacteria bacterium]|nr:class I SAM-dependent methyltransferase [Alphaproteobacteria bacterium]